jgi:hypothetical protein
MEVESDKSTSDAKPSGQESTEEAADEDKPSTAANPSPSDLEEAAPESACEASLTGNGDDPELQPPDEIKLSDQRTSNESENESEELDDIELIFTTDDTCRDVCLQEDLVSITDTENWQQPQLTPTPVRF